MVYRQLRDQFVMPEILTPRSLHHHVHIECYHSVLSLTGVGPKPSAFAYCKFLVICALKALSLCSEEPVNAL